ncbi:hypothetical protein Efla_001954 [Eimeria flavescens]
MAAATDGDLQIQQEIAAVFASAGSSSNEVQQQVAAALNRINEIPHVYVHFAAILGSCRYTPDVRQVAGLSLKTALQRPQQLQQQQLQQLLPPLLQALQEEDRGLRAAGGSAVTSLVCFQRLPQQLLQQLLQELLRLFDGPRYEVRQSALQTVSKLSEDMLQGLRLQQQDLQQQPQQLVAFIQWAQQQLLPRLLQLAMPAAAAAGGVAAGGVGADGGGGVCTPEQQEQLQQESIYALNLFAGAQGFAAGGPFSDLFPSYWAALGALAAAANPRTQRAVIQGILQTLETRPAAVVEAAGPLADFFMRCGSSPDYQLKQDAAEFWPAILREASQSSPELQQHVLQQLRQRLPQLIPLLVANTVYTETDFLSMDVSQLEDDNAGIADEAYDVAPRFHRSRDPAAAAVAAGGAAAADEDEEEEDRGARGTWGDAWSLRKGSALALDHIASVYREEILPFVLPPIEQGLQQQQQQQQEDSWLRQEAAVLTLGAVAQGCQDSLAPHLRNVLLFLLELCTHPKPLLRSISCWCISRYASWLCQTEHERQQQQQQQQQQQEGLLGPVLQQLMQRLLDRNKRVQEAACSAFACIEDDARCLLSPYLSDILATLRRALDCYQAKNQLILYDAIGTLAEGVGSALCCPQGFDLLDALLQRWAAAPPGQPQCLAISEAIGCLASAMQGAFAPYAAVTVDRCLQLIADIVQQIEAQERGEVSCWPDRDALECCLDLLSGLADALQQQMLPLLQQRQQLLLLLERCCRDTSPPVLQSALALVGDLSKHCSSLLRPQVLFPLLQQHLLHGAISVANNAGWALGELAVRVRREEVDPHAEAIAADLIRLLQRPEMHRALLQNVCITIGRLALACPNRLSPMLPEFLPRWCCVMRMARSDEDKASAFQGICGLIEANPAAASEALPDFLISLLAFERPPPQLEQQFARTVHALSNSNRERLRCICSPSPAGAAPLLPLQLQQQLTERFVYSLCFPGFTGVLVSPWRHPTPVLQLALPRIPLQHQQQQQQLLLLLLLRRHRSCLCCSSSGPSVAEERHRGLVAAIAGCLRPAASSS